MVVSKFYLSAAPWCKQTLEWAIPKKNQTGELEDILLWKLPWNFSFFYFTPGNSRQNKVQPLDIPQNCARSLGIPRPKTKIHGNSTFFLVTLGNSTLFLINPLKFHMLFLWYPWKLHILNPPVWIFSGIVQLTLMLHLGLFFIIYQ